MIELREPTENDWPAIGALANASLEGVEGAGDQAEWLQNRMNFDPRKKRRHCVALQNGALAGYASREHAVSVQGEGYRLFMVTAQADRETVGGALMDWLVGVLAEDRAPSWFIEYKTDLAFIAWLGGRGYSETRAFIWDEQEFVMLLPGATTQAAARP